MLPSACLRRQLGTGWRQGRNLAVTGCSLTQNDSLGEMCDPCHQGQQPGKTSSAEMLNYSESRHVNDDVQSAKLVWLRMRESPEARAILMTIISVHNA
jgi:hypothetical protein